MAKLTMNIEKLIEHGEDLKAIANEYNKIIDETYNKLVKVNENQALVGDNENSAASKFIKSAEADKKNVSFLGTNIYHLGEKIIVYADNMKVIADDNIGG